MTPPTGPDDPVGGVLRSDSNYSSISCDCVFMTILPCGANRLLPPIESAIRLTPSSSALINSESLCVALEQAT